jgi:hypothetical protein
MSKTTRLTATVELEIEDRCVYDEGTLLHDLEGELVTVKSGLYENVAWGHISKIKILSMASK